MGFEITPQKGAILGGLKALAVSAVVFAAKGIIQSSITACSKRDHSLLVS